MDVKVWEMLLITLIADPNIKKPSLVPTKNLKYMLY